MRFCAQVERNSPDIYRGEKYFQRKLQKEITLFVQYKFFLKSAVFEKIKRERMCYNSYGTRKYFLTSTCFALSSGVLKLGIYFMQSRPVIYSHI